MGRGRPKKQKTVTIRLHEDIVAMAGEISAHTGVPVPELLDPLLRDFLKTEFKKLLPGIKKMAAASPAVADRLQEALDAIKRAQEFKEQEAKK